MKDLPLPSLLCHFCREFETKFNSIVGLHKFSPTHAGLLLASETT